MSSRIRILGEGVANMIAAGEVVEAPFSVVKELVENSLDAGATEIAVDIKGGGSDLIRVADNGHGMNRDDALIAFNRFATSKLTSAEELASVATLGFRGEALPSIASVSRVRLTTCERGANEGTEVNLVGGEIRDVRPAGRAAGTTVEVSSLFFNTPARRKFLRSDSVEVRRIMELLTEYAVLYPSVRLDIAVDGKLALGLAAADGAAERVAGVLGGSVSKEMLPVDYTDDGGRADGLIGRPTIARPRGAQQVVAVNGRPVRSRLINAAVRSGYGELLPQNRHPVVFLMLALDPRLVDVNVHPTKREVRFSDTRAVFGLVENAVRKSLMSHDTAPTLATYEARHAGRRSASSGERGATAWMPEGGTSPRGRRTGTDLSESPSAEQETMFPATVREASGAGDGVTEELRRETGADEQHAKFWQLHQSYVFVQTREGVLVVDQHAAHERVLYEKARVALSGATESGPGQQLLFPVAVDLSPGEWASFDEARHLLGRLGFTIKEMSGRTVLMEAVPGAFPRWPHDRILQDILADLPSGDRDVRGMVESIAKTVACKAAIKAGDRLTQDEMRSLIDQLFATELPYSCPHGRPTFMRMTSEELDKRFGRT
ncbi:MAG: DNA mismatch repair endonuclease MutL [Candidatus Eisenbacteria bacterium]|nr:DNA mismatch repair endonuclease MutL [Candidatus Eisenbacteria bacterium]